MPRPRPAVSLHRPGSGPPPWQEQVRGGYSDRHAAGLSGIEQLRAMVSGDVPQPPISRLTGMRLAEVRDGEATFRMPLTRWLCSPQGAISIGPLTMPADGAVACSIITQLPPGMGLTTSELSLRVLAPVTPGGAVAARGRVIQVRRTLALAEVGVYDERERLIAHGSSLCFVQAAPSPAMAEPPAPQPTPPEPQPAPEQAAPPGPLVAQEPTPDPYARPAAGAVIPQEVWDRMSGLEVLRGQLAGRLPMPPIHYLTGLTLTAASAGQATFTLPASEWLCAPARARIQGGAVALLGEAALSAAIQTRIPAGTALAPVDLKVNYLRPLIADGRATLGRGRVLHAGRRIAVASAEVLDADGRAVAIATGSAMILPNRPAALGAPPP